MTTAEWPAELLEEVSATGAEVMITVRGGALKSGKLAHYSDTQYVLLTGKRGRPLVFSANEVTFLRLRP